MELIGIDVSIWRLRSRSASVAVVVMANRSGAFLDCTLSERMLQPQSLPIRGRVLDHISIVWIWEFKGKTGLETLVRMALHGLSEKRTVRNKDDI